MRQANSTVEDGADPRLYEVGALLRFIEKDPDELTVDFYPGDILVVEVKNACGMGIDARRVNDGMVDMVWPTEVELL